ncbi:Uncharacterised protein [Chromobacterium violaceum]|uniref:Uncharacterized protein n=1 Tax=Chromobacterium violaceum TaxID=536 RepID=A0A447T7V5_CHRVL|nr:Uncharacterised protein [Chromobacterium violaceum]
MMPFGRRSKCFFTSSTIFSFGILLVPKVSTAIEVGSATPIAYDTWIWHWRARPAATMFFAT